MSSVFCNGYEFKNIEAVLFDKDGTFVDSDLYWGKIGETRIRTVIEYYRLDESLFNELCEVIGLNPVTMRLIDNGPLAVLSRNEVIEALVGALNKYVCSTFEEIDEIFNKVHEESLKNLSEYVKLIDGSIECFKRLREKGIKLAVVTSDSYKNTCESLKVMGIDGYFDAVIGKDSCDEPKRTGKPAVLAMQKLGVNPKNAITVGDAPMDSQMTKNAFMQGSILVKTGQTSVEDLISNATVVCDNLNYII